MAEVHATMPLYMDVHRNIGVDTDGFEQAHANDIDAQQRHGVTFRRYWIDEDEGVAFCLFEAPNKEAGEAVHREAHGLLANEIYEVQSGGKQGVDGL